LKLGFGPENPIFGQKWAKKDRFLTIFCDFSTLQDFEFFGGIRHQKGVFGPKPPRGSARLAPMSKLKNSQKSRSSPLFNRNSVGKYEKNGHIPSHPLVFLGRGEGGLGLGTKLRKKECNSFF
jgi:hypothetical protein